ncbi:N-formylglutamate amidohydrolase [Azospirillum picis]|uniref:N-formylglutamate amidohydrolase n=1 Tax=Azospirillum picis TaxID=488438 RepID=A0ABU0MQA6_9PROT|nr:N-formylglutamate amidohydrolase [Azospirillum picis]MBP2301658.1 N-formylglutamate amidohydrolase [Azospirillum picis]MDQ0535519.1 N-formylglutamate amidohydrolase [Azospirillum picis]
MDASFDAQRDAGAGSDPAIDAPAFEILAPPCRRLPLVLASPHSGNAYSAGFLASSRLDAQALRKSEDCFVDQIFAFSPGLGAPLIRALFPRAYLDVNREAYELDPEMFADPLPAYVNSRSPRVAAGLGTIARVVANGEDIYKGRLRFAEALDRINRCYLPYHAALRRLVDETRDAFGHALLVDCHSMPSSAPNTAAGTKGGRGGSRGNQPEIVLGDCFGNACAPAIIDAAEDFLRGLGYAVSRNNPYAGGYTTRHYGRPRQGIHALQIEIARDLYMDEATLTRLPYLDVLSRHMTALVDTLGLLPSDGLGPR